MEQRLFHVIVPRKNHMLDFILFISKLRGGGGSELESRAYIFKIISLHELFDMNWEPNEKIYSVFAKILRPVRAKVFYHQQPDNNEPEELTEVKIRAFNSSIGIHQNDFVENSCMQEEKNFCEVSQDTDALFIHLIKFSCIFLIALCPPMFYATPFTSLFIYWSVSIICRAGFVLGICKSIIVDFIAIC